MLKNLVLSKLATLLPGNRSGYITAYTKNNQTSWFYIILAMERYM
jgi:hypothetical protein